MDSSSTKPDGYDDVWRELPTLLFLSLTKGKFVVIDAADRPLIPGKWHLHTSHGKHYAAQTAYSSATSQSARSLRLMHRIILGAAAHLCDHKNGDGLDNRRSNLRAATHTQNMRNRKASRTNKAGFKGICTCRRGGGRKKIHRAQIWADKKRTRSGSFHTIEDAAAAYDVLAIRLHGEFARLNFPDRRPEYERQLAQEKQSI